MATKRIETRRIAWNNTKTTKQEFEKYEFDIQLVLYINPFDKESFIVRNVYMELNDIWDSSNDSLRKYLIEFVMIDRILYNIDRSRFEPRDIFFSKITNSNNVVLEYERMQNSLILNELFLLLIKMIMLYDECVMLQNDFTIDSILFVSTRKFRRRGGVSYGDHMYLSSNNKLKYQLVDVVDKYMYIFKLILEWMIVVYNVTQHSYLSESKMIRDIFDKNPSDAFTIFNMIYGDDFNLMQMYEIIYNSDMTVQTQSILDVFRKNVFVDFQIMYQHCNFWK